MTSYLNLFTSFLNLRPIFSSFVSGILVGLIEPPLFYFWGIIGFTIFLYQIKNSKSFYSLLQRHFAFGMGFFGYGFYWTTIAISTRIEEFWWAIPIALIGMPLIFVCITIFSSYISWRVRDSKYLPLVFSLSWVFIEWVSGFIFTGLPWMIVGYGAGFSDIFSQSASLVSLYGVSLIIIYMASKLMYILQNHKLPNLFETTSSILLLLTFFIYGYQKLEKNQLEFSDKVVRLIQPSIIQNEKWTFGNLLNVVQKQIKLSKLKARKDPDIIIWSETAITTNYKNHVIFELISNLSREMNAVIMSGAVAVEGNNYYNAFVGISSEDGVIFEYRKKHLVPFGEYVPLREYLPIKKLTYGISDYKKGEGPDTFYVKHLDMKIRPLICYETLFPHELNSPNADLFINVTNSAWYGNSSAPYHLFYVNKFRAIENSTPIVVVSNNGISGMFDSQGRLIAKTGLNDITALDLYIPIKKGSESTNPLYGFFALALLISYIEYRGNRYVRKRK